MSNSSQKKKITINWVGALFLLLSPVAAVLFTIMHVYIEGFRWPIWALAVVFYALSAGSITGGYHRLFAHRAYESRTWLKWFWALFGAAAFQNSILIWARDHRVHHRFVDSDQDPYSINKGFFWAHFGWMLVDDKAQASLAVPYGRDLERDPVVAFQHKHYVLLAIAMGLGLPALIGYFLGSAFGGLAVAGFARIVLLHHATFLINSWCHMWGKQTYTDTNTARDSLILAVLTFGEGYHNFHHIFANDYRNGIRWYHWDPTKWMIQVFAMLGGAYSLRRTPQGEILLAQMQMEEKNLKAKLSDQWQAQFQEQIDAFKIRVESAQKRFEHLRAEYRQMAKQYRRSSMDRLDEIRKQIELARNEMREALRQWREFQTLLLNAQMA
ncbi:MAG: fatty acid desaturase [Bdellovibrionales bacterium]